MGNETTYNQSFSKDKAIEPPHSMLNNTKIVYHHQKYYLRS